MKLARLMLVACALVSAAALAGCSSDMNGNAGNANANANASPSPAAQTLKTVEPKDGATVNGPTVKLKLELSGDLKGYQPHKVPASGMGNHIHVILDNEPYEAYYNLDQPFELRNLTEGQHTIRVFPSRPWHESYKNDGAFQMVTFNVKGGGDASTPTTPTRGAEGAREPPGEAHPAREAGRAGQPREPRPRLAPRRDARRQRLPGEARRH